MCGRETEAPITVRGIMTSPTSRGRLIQLLSQASSWTWWICAVGARFARGQMNPIPSIILSPFWCASQAYWQTVVALNDVARQRFATIVVQRFKTIIFSPAAQKDIQVCTKICCLIYCSGNCGVSVASSCRNRQKMHILLLYEILWNYFSNYYRMKLLFISPYLF